MRFLLQCLTSSLFASTAFAASWYLPSADQNVNKDFAPVALSGYRVGWIQDKTFASESLRLRSGTMGWYVEQANSSISLASGIGFSADGNTLCAIRSKDGQTYERIDYLVNSADSSSHSSVLIGTVVDSSSDSSFSEFYRCRTNGQKFVVQGGNADAKVQGIYVYSNGERLAVLEEYNSADLQIKDIQISGERVVVFAKDSLARESIKLYGTDGKLIKFIAATHTPLNLGAFFNAEDLGSSISFDGDSLVFIAREHVEDPLVLYRYDVSKDEIERLTADALKSLHLDVPLSTYNNSIALVLGDARVHQQELKLLNVKDGLIQSVESLLKTSDEIAFSKNTVQSISLGPQGLRSDMIVVSDNYLGDFYVYQRSPAAVIEISDWE